MWAKLFIETFDVYGVSRCQKCWIYFMSSYSDLSSFEVENPQHILKSARRSTRFISGNEGLSKRYNQRGVFPQDEEILARLFFLPIRVKNFAICLFRFLMKEVSWYYTCASIICERIVCKMVSNIFSPLVLLFRIDEMTTIHQCDIEMILIYISCNEEERSTMKEKEWKFNFSLRMTVPLNKGRNIRFTWKNVVVLRSSPLH